MSGADGFCIKKSGAWARLAKFTQFAPEHRYFSPPYFDRRPAGPYHARAMGNPLRVRRPITELAAKGQAFEIAEKIGSFERLAGIVEADLAALDPDKIPEAWRESMVTGRLAFGFADAQQQVVALVGEVAVTVDAVCQRCLEPFRLTLECELRLLPTTEQEGVSAGADFELWELDDELVCPAEIVEEVLIMAMPLSAMHDAAEACREFESGGDESEQMTRPFAALKARLDQNK
jgi:uncharacterized metal-binding protein YceD (DUF177 family)